MTNTSDLILIEKTENPAFEWKGHNGMYVWGIYRRLFIRLVMPRRDK